ncbi:MAG: hypothetical protein PHP03_03925 [Candidatus Pacebacteria bacterium]|nr:hypothetical protein [Candidatus Paceibacterota bacterium]
MFTDSNLLAKADAAEVDTSIPKISVLAALAVIAAMTFGYFTDILLRQISAPVFISAAASAVLFIILFFLQSIFIKGKTLNLSIILAETIGLSLFFVLNDYSFIMLAAAAIAYFALFVSLKNSKNELKNQLKINVMPIMKMSVPKTVAAIAILVAAVYSQPFYPDHIVISKDLINSIVRPSETLIKFADNYLHLGLNNFSVNMTLFQLANGDPAYLAALESQAASWGIKIASNETILDATYNYVNDKVQKLNQTVKWAIFGVILLLAFLTVKSLFWLVYWLIYLLIFLFYEILMALGFCRISSEQISKEIIIL